MSNEPSKPNQKVAKLQKAHDDLMSKYQHALLDLKKVKLDVQEEQLKFKEQIFSLRQKMTLFESELNNLKHKASFSRTEYDALCAEQEQLEKEIAKIEDKLSKTEKTKKTR